MQSTEALIVDRKQPRTCPEKSPRQTLRQKCQSYIKSTIVEER
jgi:hypothetical protein